MLSPSSFPHLQLPVSMFWITEWARWLQSIPSLFLSFCLLTASTATSTLLFKPPYRHFDQQPTDSLSHLLSLLYLLFCLSHGTLVEDTLSWPRIWGQTFPKLSFPGPCVSCISSLGKEKVCQRISCIPSPHPPPHPHSALDLPYSQTWVHLHFFKNKRATRGTIREPKSTSISFHRLCRISQSAFKCYEKCIQNKAVQFEYF